MAFVERWVTMLGGRQLLISAEGPRFEPRWGDERNGSYTVTHTQRVSLFQ